MEDFCGVEPITHPPELMETRPPLNLDEDKVNAAYHETSSALVGGIVKTEMNFGFFKSLLMNFFCRRIIIFIIFTLDPGGNLDRSLRGATQRRLFDARRTRMRSSLRSGHSGHAFSDWTFLTKEKGMVYLSSKSTIM